MFDAVDTVIAARGALRVIDDAARMGDTVPRVFGSDAALRGVQARLGEAAELLDAAAAGLPADAADAARMLQDAGAGVREAASVAQTRAGARQLGQHVAAPRARIEKAFSTLRAAGADVLDDDLVLLHVLLRRDRTAMNRRAWSDLESLLLRSEQARAVAPMLGAKLAREAADLHHRFGAVPAEWRGWTRFDDAHARITYRTRHQASMRLADLAGLDPSDVGLSELSSMAAIARLPDDVRPAAITQSVERVVRDGAERVARGASLPNDWRGWDVLRRAAADAAFPDAKSASRRLEELARLGYDEVDMAGWRDLHRIMSLGNDRLPTVLRRTDAPVQELSELASAMRAGAPPEPSWLGWDRLDALRASITMPDQAAASARFDELASMRRAELTRDQLHEFNGIVRLPDDLRPAVLDGLAPDEVIRAVDVRAGLPDTWSGLDVVERGLALRRWQSRDVATSHLESVLGSTFDEMNADSWRDLLRLSLLPDDVRPSALAAHSDFPDLRSAADAGGAAGDVAADWAGWSQLDATRARLRHGTREAAEARLGEIALRPRDELTRADLHDVAGLAQLGDDARPATLRDASASEVAHAAELRGRGSAINPEWGGWKVLDAAEAVTRWPTREAATADLTALLGRSWDEVGPNRWRSMARMAALPTDLRPPELRLPGGRPASEDLAAMADLVEQGATANPKWGGWSQLNRLRAEAAWTTREQAQVRLQQLVDKTEDQLTRQDLHDLDGLLQLPDERRPLLLHGATLSNVAEAAELRGRQQTINAEWDGWNLLRGVRISTRWPDRAAATRTLSGTLGQPYDDMDAAAWRTLSDIALLPAERRPEGLVHANGAGMTNELRQIAGLLDQGTPINGAWGGWRRLNRLRADFTYPTREQAEARLQQLIDKTEDQLTRQDFHDLDGLLQLGDHARPPLLNGLAVTDLPAAAELRKAGKPINHQWGGWEILAGIRATRTWPTREAALADAASLLVTGYDDLDGQAWRRLADIATLPSEMRPALPSAADLRAMAHLLETGQARNPKWGGWRALNSMRAETSWTTPQLAALRLRELSAKGRDQLTRQDFHDLDGLMQLPPERRPTALGTSQINDAAEAGELRGAGTAINPAWGGWTVLEAAGIEARLPPDPAARAEWIRTQLSARLRGAEPDPMLGTLLRLRPDLVPSDLDGPGRLMVANEMLRDIATVGVTGPQAPKPALQAARHALDGWQPGSDAAVDALMRRTMALVDDNLERMAGKHAGKLRGYSSYTDLAEVGRIRSNLELLEHLHPATADAAASVTTHAGDAGTGVTPGAAGTADATSATGMTGPPAETLTW